MWLKVCIPMMVTIVMMMMMLLAVMVLKSRVMMRMKPEVKLQNSNEPCHHVEVAELNEY